MGPARFIDKAPVSDSRNEQYRVQANSSYLAGIHMNNRLLLLQFNWNSFRVTPAPSV